MARSLAMRPKRNTSSSSSLDSSCCNSTDDGPYRNLRRRVSRSDWLPATAAATREEEDDRKPAAVETGACNSKPKTKRKKTLMTVAVQVPLANQKDPTTLLRAEAPFTRSKQRTLNQVTPSPAQNVESPAFSFTSPLPSKRNKSRVFDYSSKMPKGVVELYPSKDSPLIATLGHSRCYFCKQDACSSNSLSASFIQTYGQEYCQIMKENERSIIAPSSPCSSPSPPTSQASPVPPLNMDSENNQHLFESPVPSTGGSSSDVAGSSVVSKETPHHRRVWTNVDTSNLSAVKAVESKRFLDYQPDLTPKMRAILMDWIVELSEHFNFGPGTLHLACTLVDQVLACGPLSFENEDEEAEESRWETEDGTESKTYCFLISRERFQLLGATCTWLACKMEEQTPPEVSQIAYVSDNIYSVEQIKRMERRVCSALGWALARQTPYPYIHEFMRASNECPNPSCELPPTFQYTVLYLLELGRLPYMPVTKKPSLLAAAAVYLARATLGLAGAGSGGGGELWTKTLEYYTGYSKNDLKEVVLAIHSYQIAAEDSSLKSAFSKYKTKKYRRVALKTVPRQEDLGF